VGGLGLWAALVAADFERTLGTRPVARSDHFVIHHLPPEGELSTDRTAPAWGLVEDARRFGLVVPKRHARRAVTRSLIKRQGRCSWLRHAPSLPPGVWLLRLRSPFDTQRFPSAASTALRGCVRGELDGIFARVVKARK
jgi:ribonuclease P protein component